MNSQSPIRIRLEVRIKEESFICDLLNESGRSVTIRDISPNSDVIVTNLSDKNRVQCRFQSTFGRGADILHLRDNEVHNKKIDLKKEFYFREKGNYSVALAYDSQKKIAAWLDPKEQRIEELRLLTDPIELFVPEFWILRA